VHTTNYVHTFIAVAEDCPAEVGTVPPERKTPSVAMLTYRALADAPYSRDSDAVIFGVFADRKEIPAAERDDARATFFSKGQACLRASDLGRRYGWGTHHDGEGRVALVGRETPEYARLLGGEAPDGTPVKVVRAMRSKRG